MPVVAQNAEGHELDLGEGELLRQELAELVTGRIIEDQLPVPNPAQPALDDAGAQVSMRPRTHIILATQQSTARQRNPFDNQEGGRIVGWDMLPDDNEWWILDEAERASRASDLAELRSGRRTAAEINAANRVVPDGGELQFPEDLDCLEFTLDDE